GAPPRGVVVCCSCRDLPAGGGLLAGILPGSLSVHSPPEAVKLALRFRRAFEVASVDRKQHFPEPCDRGFLGPERIRRLGSRHRHSPSVWSGSRTSQHHDLSGGVVGRWWVVGADNPLFY